ncbi:CvpA family protein [Oceanospirillum sp.]|uniref:CvpA family protein n=1 Tax=Oceanospirillum sp. TaxID=2021254 RepID=UPI003A94B03F
MVWIDWAIIAILVLSAIFGLIRGMIKELVALATWIAAIMIARLFGPQVSDMLIPYIDNTTIRNGLGFALTAIIIVMLGSMISRAAHSLVTASGLGGFDRILGFIFGGIRGVAILVILTAVVSLTPLADSGWWSESQFIPMLENLRDQAAGLVDRQIS